MGMIERLEKLFRILCQFDISEFDFGIYRIMNYKRKKIEDFVKGELVQVIEGEFEKYKYQIDEFMQNQIFDDLYRFFLRYYENGNFISRKCIIPHSGEDVKLYWINSDQYYVNTNEIFKDYSFDLEGWRIIFKTVFIEVRNINNKRKYFFLKENDFIKVNKEQKSCIIYFEYRYLSDEDIKNYKITADIKQKMLNNIIKDKIVEQISEIELKEIFSKIKDNKTILEKHLCKYMHIEISDFFIHKDLKGFLERELDYYIKTEIVDLNNLESKHIIRAKVVDEIAKRIIKFLAQIEEFQKLLWEKKKFVLKTEYVITMDRIPLEFYDEIFKNNQQLKEWEELGFGKIKDKNDIKGRKLPIDTKYFSQDFKERLLEKLSEKGNIDELLDGVLIKSENYQALNLILNKYKDKVQTIYIDPPYNTGNDEFLYKDKYQHSSWLTMMENRLSLAKRLMRDDGVIFVSIDDNEVSNLYNIMRSFYFEVEKLKIKMRNPARQLTQKSIFQKSIEYCLVFSKSEKMSIKKKKVDYDFSEYKLKIIEKDKPFKTFTIGKYKIECFRPDQYEIIECSEINDFYIVKPISIRGKIKTAQFTEKFYEENLRPLFEKEKNYNYLYKVYGIGDDGFGFRYIKNPDERTINTVYYQGIPLKIRKELNSAQTEISYFDFYDFEKDMNNESKIIRDMELISLQSIKPIHFIKFLISMIEEDKIFILDFFAGSGTTAHAVMKLNKEDGGKRKFILVEMADYFDTIIIPRMKKIAYSFNWKEGKPQDIDGIGVFLKYHYLEQYEDTLHNIEFVNKDKGQSAFELFGNEYLMKYFLRHKIECCQSLLNIQDFENPFEYKMKIISGNKGEEIVNIDLIETFNYLLGLTINKYKFLIEDGRKYVFVFGEKEDKKVVVIWRCTKGINLKKDREMIEKIISGYNPDEIFINGSSL